jgi:hypothetical protein
MKTEKLHVEEDGLGAIWLCQGDKVISEVFFRGDDTMEEMDREHVELIERYPDAEIPEELLEEELWIAKQSPTIE